jgi:hypothetical protein
MSRVIIWFIMRSTTNTATSVSSLLNAAKPTWDWDCSLDVHLGVHFGKLFRRTSLYGT